VDRESSGERHQQKHDPAHRVACRDLGDNETAESDCGAREPARTPFSEFFQSIKAVLPPGWGWRAGRGLLTSFYIRELMD
jgi:hypothetical protein